MSARIGSRAALVASVPVVLAIAIAVTGCGAHTSTADGSSPSAGPDTGPAATTPTGSPPSAGAAVSAQALRSVGHESPTIVGGVRASDGAGLRGKTIVLDPGHNGANGAHPEIINRKVNIVTGTKACNTTGTETNAGYAEHAFTWDIAQRTQKILSAAGAHVILTRTNDAGVGPCINERAAIATRAHADASVSIHADGGPISGRGFHVIMPGDVGPNHAIVSSSAQLGRILRDAFRTGAGEPYATYIAHDGLDTRSDLGGLNLATVPSVFIECGNMRESTDAAQLASSAWRQRAAQAIADGITRFVGR